MHIAHFQAGEIDPIFFQLRTGSPTTTDAWVESSVLHWHTLECPTEHMIPNFHDWKKHKETSGNPVNTNLNFLSQILWVHWTSTKIFFQINWRTMPKPVWVMIRLKHGYSKKTIWWSSDEYRSIIFTDCSHWNYTKRWFGFIWCTAFYTHPFQAWQ